MYALTIFKNLYDNKTDKRMDFDTWHKFEGLLYQLSQRPLADKKDAELISPAVFEVGTTRANANVTEWASWAAVDVDEHVFEGDLESELRSKYGDMYYVCYSTASSTPEHPKFRLVFPLKSSVPQDQIKSFWYALQSHLGEIGDKQTKDLSRMYFTPATYAGANNFIFTNTASFVDPIELMVKYPYEGPKMGATFLDRLPLDWADKIINTRRSQLDNTNVYWSSYHNCPYWPKKLAAEYIMISDGGWYRKMYAIMLAIAGNAIKNKYPITANEIAQLVSEFDRETGNWYENRPLLVEADRAIEYIYKSGV